MRTMKVSENISVKNLNSFGVEARAARLIEWDSVEDLAAAAALFEAGPWMALGGGNNILFTGDYDGTLVKSGARNIEITNRTAETVSVRAEAGVRWDDFVRWCVERGLWGVENLSGIPGTVGAAPIQNIGAYGAEAKDVIASVECFVVATRNTLTLAAEHCDFGYRDSIFKRDLKGKVIVTAVDFLLSTLPRPNLEYTALAEKVTTTGSGEVTTTGSGEVAVTGHPPLEDICRAVVELRNSKLPDPAVQGNAGSFFKNPVVPAEVARNIAKKITKQIANDSPTMPQYPAGADDRVKLSAGWLIEQAGWRGRSVGRVCIHPRQALVVVNLGGASGREIADFALAVQNGVKAAFGVELTPEVNIV